MKLTLQARNPSGGGVVNTVILNHLRLDRGNPNGLNKAQDVDAIHMYIDSNNNGIYDPGVDKESPTRVKPSSSLMSVSPWRWMLQLRWST